MQVRCYRSAVILLGCNCSEISVCWKEGAHQQWPISPCLLNHQRKSVFHLVWIHMKYFCFIWLWNIGNPLIERSTYLWSKILTEWEMSVPFHFEKQSSLSSGNSSQQHPSRSGLLSQTVAHHLTGTTWSIIEYDCWLFSNIFKHKVQSLVLWPSTWSIP